jgi:hypothetical protein
MLGEEICIASAAGSLRAVARIQAGSALVWEKYLWKDLCQSQIYWFLSELSVTGTLVWRGDRIKRFSI